MKFQNAVATVLVAALLSAPVLRAAYLLDRKLRADAQVPVQLKRIADALEKR